MSFGDYPFHVLSEIRGITSHLLARFTTEEIVKSFSSVEKVLADFKQNHPDQIPIKTDVGLFSLVFPFNDFELAQHLIITNEPEMMRVFNESEGVPVLIAYLEVIINNHDLPDEFLLTSALPYAVHARTIKGDVAENWNKVLLPLSVKALKQSANQASRRTNKTKLSDSQKKQVVREYEAAPVIYGMVKSLARKYDVSPDTISRIVNPKPIQKETKQD